MERTRIEPTEFEKAIECFRDKIEQCEYHHEADPIVDYYQKELLSLARKQIVEEVDVNCMVNSFAKEKTSNEVMIFEVYSKGITDTLKKIKGK